MAEKLKRAQPTSSIANALNLAAVHEATKPASIPPEPRPRASDVAPPHEYVPSTPVAPQRGSIVNMPSPSLPPAAPRQQQSEPVVYASREPTGEPADIIRQLHLTATTDATLQRVIAAYSRAIGFELTKTEFFRAVLHALEPTVELHVREASTLGRLRRHKNEAWLFHKRDELERAIAAAFTAAMRAAPTMK